MSAGLMSGEDDGAVSSGRTCAKTNIRPDVKTIRKTRTVVVFAPEKGKKKGLFF